MCGRFVNINKISRVKKLFDIKSNLEIKKDIISYNIAPSQNVNIIINNKILDVETANWGIDFFDKRYNLKRKVINSRLETIQQKILFKESFFHRRCLIPVNGYFEWKTKDGIKMPYFFQLGDLAFFFFAGIWKFSTINNLKIKTFSIITKEANMIVNQIHKRMPVIMDIYEGKNYLKENDFLIESNFISKFEEFLFFEPVSKFVNSPQNNTLECIKTIN